MQRRELMHEFIQTHLGQWHVYTVAIHNPSAALDGGEQPHAHLMFSERIQDSIQRDPGQYFKRYNAKAPDRGGCRKDSMGTLERLQTFRESWADLTNQALERYGHSVPDKARNYRDRGIEREPEKHLGPVDARKLSTQDREALREHRQAQHDVAHAGVYGEFEKNPTIFRKYLKDQSLRTIRLNSLRVVAAPPPAKADRLSRKRPFM